MKKKNDYDEEIQSIQNQMKARASSKAKESGREADDEEPTEDESEVTAQVDLRKEEEEDEEEAKAEGIPAELVEQDPVEQPPIQNVQAEDDPNEPEQEDPDDVPVQELQVPVASTPQATHITSHPTPVASSQHKRKDVTPLSGAVAGPGPSTQLSRNRTEARDTDENAPPSQPSKPIPPQKRAVGQGITKHRLSAASSSRERAPDRANKGKGKDVAKEAVRKKRAHPSSSTDESDGGEPATEWKAKDTRNADRHRRIQEVEVLLRGVQSKIISDDR